MNGKERDALERIVKYCDRAASARARHFPTKDRFDEDAFYCDGIARHIMQTGECVTVPSDEFKARHDRIPWHRIRGMRNIIAHAYGSVDAEEVWHILTEDLPGLREYCAEAVAEDEAASW